MASITLKGREIPLLYTTMEMKQIQEEVAPMNIFLRLLFGKEEGDGKDKASLYGSPEHLNALAKTIRIMGNAALEEAGKEPDLTDKWILRAMKPVMIPDAMGACLEEFNTGMESEIPDTPKSGEPVDVTLQELQEKKETAG